MDKRNWIIGGIGFAITMVGAIFAGIGPIFNDYGRQTFTMTPFGFSFMIVGTLVMVYALVMILRSAGDGASRVQKPAKPVEQSAPQAQPREIPVERSVPIQESAPRPVAQPQPMSPSVPTPGSGSPLYTPQGSTTQHRPYYTSQNPVSQPGGQPPRI